MYVYGHCIFYTYCTVNINAYINIYTDNYEMDRNRLCSMVGTTWVGALQRMKERSC